MTAGQRDAKSHPARLLSTLLALCFILGAPFDPLPAQEPWNPEARRLLSLVPESTSSLQRDHIRAGMQRDGYPAPEAGFTGGADLVQLFIVHEVSEGGRTARMAEDSMFAIRPEPMVLDNDPVVAVSVGQPIGGELEDRVTSSNVNTNLSDEFEGIEQPHRVEVAGHPAMMAVYAGTDARGRRVINRHVIMRPEGREIHIATYVPEGVWQEVAPLLEALITSLRIAG